MKNVGGLGLMKRRAELVAAGEERGNTYLTALKALSQNARPTPIIRRLDFAGK
jgi:hypothetical protein